MRRAAILALSALLASPALAGPPSLLWSRLHAPAAGGLDDYGGAVFDLSGDLRVLHADDRGGFHVRRISPSDGSGIGDLALAPTSMRLDNYPILLKIASGDFVVAGRSSGFNNSRVGAARYNPTTGAVIWATCWMDSTRHYTPAGAAIDGGGDVYVLTSDGDSSSPTRHPLVVKISVTGSVVWARTIQGVGVTQKSDGSAIAGKPAGGCYVTGSDATMGHAVLWSVDANGEVSWTATMPGSGSGVDCDASHVWVAAQDGDRVGVMKWSAAGIPETGMGLTANISYLRITGLAVAPDGTPYVSGKGRSSGYDSGLLVQFDPLAMTPLWTQIYDYATGESTPEQVRGVAIDGSGVPYLVTNLGGGGDCQNCTTTNDLLVRMVDAGSGGAAWENPFDSPPATDLLDAATDSSGNVYLVNTRPAALVKYSPDGTLQWSRSHGDPLYCAYGFARVTVAGGVEYVSAKVRMTTTYCGEGQDIVNVSRFNEFGNQLPDWSWTPAWGSVEPGKLVPDGSGNFYLGVTTRTNTGTQMTYGTVVKFLSSGTVAWTATVFGGPENKEGVNGIGVDSLGNAYVTVPSSDVAGNMVMGLAKILTDGTVSWSMTVTAGLPIAYPTSLATVPAAGRVYVAGLEADSFSAPTVWRGVIVGFDLSGNVVWTATSDGGQQALYWALSADPSGTLFAVGTVSPSLSIGEQGRVSGGGTADILVHAWDPSDGCKAPVWTARWDSGLGDDSGLSVAAGSVYVLGSTPSGPEIIKYQQGQGDPAALSASITASPAGPVPVGSQVAIHLTISNIGGRDALSPTTTLMISSGANAFGPLEGPWTVGQPVITGGSSRTWMWTTTATAAAIAQLTATGTGTDACSALTVTAATAPTLQAAYKSVPVAAIAITRTICGIGDWVRVDLTVTNEGLGSASMSSVTASIFLSDWSDVSWVAGQDQGDFTLTAGAKNVFSWTFSVSGASAGLIDFTASASGTDVVFGPLGAAAAGGVELVDQARLTVTPPPGGVTSVGGVFVYPVTVTNIGGAAADGVTATIMISGSAALAPFQGPVPGLPVTIEAGSSTTFVWTFTATGAGFGTFTVTATGTDASMLGYPLVAHASGSGTVVTAAALSATVIVGYPNPANVGQLFRVVLTVSNSGQATATGVNATMSATGSVVFLALPPLPQDIAGGATAVFTWTCQGSAAGTPVFTTTVTALDAPTMRPVSTPLLVSAPETVQAPAAITGKVAVSRTLLCAGYTTLITLTISNSGQTAANAVSASAFTPTSGGGMLTKAAGPWPAFPVTLGGGATMVFTWTYSGSVAGSVDLTTTLFGVDAITGAGISSGPIASPSVLVQAPGVLATAASAPASVSIGQEIAVRLTVTNTGGATVAGVAATVYVGTGSGLVTAGSWPLAALDLAGGSSTTFEWRFTPTGFGPVVFTLTAAGAVCSTSLASSWKTISTAIQTPPVLSGSLANSPSVVEVDQPFLRTYTLSNSGQAAAVGLFDLRVGAGTTTVTMVSTSPTWSTTLAGGQTIAYTATLVGSTPGTYWQTRSATGHDINTGLPVETGLITSNMVTVQQRPILAGTLSAFKGATTRAHLGQGFLVVMTVSNSGGTTAGGVRPAPLAVFGGGTAAAVAGPNPSSTVSIAAAGTAVFTWTVAGSAAGTVYFTCTAAGLSALSGSTVFTAAVVSNTFYLGSLLTVSATSSIPSINGGQTSVITMTISNTGWSTAALIKPYLSMNPGDAATTISGPSATGLTLAPGQSTTVSWEMSGLYAATVSVTAYVNARDGLDTTYPVTAIALTVVDVNSSLKSHITVSSNPAYIGDVFRVELTVTLGGTTLLNNLTPTIVVDQPTLASVGGNPPLVTDVYGGDVKTFTWTGVGLSAGTLRIDVAASGTLLTGDYDTTRQTVYLVITERPATVPPSTTPPDVPVFDGDGIVYPNPVSGDTTTVAARLKEAASSIEVDIYNTGYQRIWHGDYPGAAAGAWPLKVTGISRWAPGVYLVRIRLNLASGGTRLLSTIRIRVKRK